MGIEGGPRCRILTSEVWRRDLKYPMKIKTDFAYDSDGIGKGGTATVFVDHKKVAKGRIEGTMPVYTRASTKRWTTYTIAKQQSDEA